MALPPTVRVKLSSEAAEAISLTPVVVQEFAIRELVEHILGITGKDHARVAELLLRGTVVVSASRFRWQGWQVEIDALAELLATFPDPDPARPFSAAQCHRAILRGGRQAIDLSREAGSRKGMFQRGTFWDALMGVVAGGDSGYAGYSYRERCDRYLRELSVAETQQIREAAEAIRYTTLRDQVRGVAFSRVELFAGR